MSTCECGRKMPRDWTGEPCFYCWIGAPISTAIHEVMDLVKNDQVRFVTEANGITIKETSENGENNGRSKTMS